MSARVMYGSGGEMSYAYFPDPLRTFVAGVGGTVPASAESSLSIRLFDPVSEDHQRESTCLKLPLPTHTSGWVQRNHSTAVDFPSSRPRFVKGSDVDLAGKVVPGERSES